MFFVPVSLLGAWLTFVNNLMWFYGVVSAIIEKSGCHYVHNLSIHVKINPNCLWSDFCPRCCLLDLMALVLYISVCFLFFPCNNNLHVFLSQVWWDSVAQCGSGGVDSYGSGSTAGSEDWSPQAPLPSLLCGRTAIHSGRVSPAVSGSTSGQVYYQPIPCKDSDSDILLLS